MARSACPSCRWITSSETRSRDISTACVRRGGWRANRRRTPAANAELRRWLRMSAGEHGRPRVGPRGTQNNAPTRRPTRAVRRVADVAGNSFASPGHLARMRGAPQLIDHSATQEPPSWPALLHAL
jgi:hypothetical protein